MSSNSVAFPIGTATELTPLFAYSPTSVTLEVGIEHTLNQTLLRDLFYGSWAQTWLDTKSGQYQLQISSPHADHDFAAYTPMIPAFIAAASTGLGIYNANKTRLPTEGFSFLPPFGLSMANTRSIQLLHYPPSETVDFMDYLYSPTNRRWENLLAYNAYPGAENTLVETIVDLVPIAADGGSAGSTALEAVQDAFVTYAREMLNVYLRPSPGGTATQPIVAHGGPVIGYLETNFNQSKLDVLSLISLQLLAGGPATPVLCANHPSRFFYYEPGQEKEFKEMLVQDLTAAGWQTKMSQNPDGDPGETLQAVSQYWEKNSKLVDRIFAEQVAEFEG
jgi:hypothetical protein